MKNLIKKLEDTKEAREKVDLSIAIFEKMDDINNIEFKGKKVRKYLFFILYILPELFHKNKAYKECIKLCEYYIPYIEDDRYETIFKNHVEKNIQNDETDFAFGIWQDQQTSETDTYNYLIASYIQIEKIEKAYELYKNNYGGYERYMADKIYDYEYIFETYFQIVALEKELKPNSKENVSIFNKIAKLYFEDYGNRVKALEYLDKVFEIDADNIEALVFKIDIDHEKDDDFEKSNRAYLELIKKTDKDIFVINSYIDFYYPYRGKDEGTQYCISLSEELINQNQTVDYYKLASFYCEFEEEEKEFKAYLEAEKHQKSLNEDPYLYYCIGWYYDEVLKDYHKALEYYTKYRKHNSVWCSSGEKEIEDKIKELENKIKR